jgi:hypothetical protein
MKRTQHRSLFQINTRVWLTESSKKLGRPAKAMTPSPAGFISMFLRGNTTFLK